MEEFFRENRQAFDLEEPGQHVWEKIRRSIVKPKSVVIIWKAAAVFFFMTTAYLFMESTTVSATNQQLESNRNSFTKVENYYTEQISLREGWLNESNQPGLIDLRGEYDRLLAMYEVLKMEWEKHPSAEIQDAMTLNLIVRLDLLNKQMDGGRRQLFWQ